MKFLIIKVFLVLTFYCQTVILKSYYDKDKDGLNKVGEAVHLLKSHNHHTANLENKTALKSHHQTVKPHHPVRHHNAHQHHNSHHNQKSITTTTTTSTTLGPLSKPFTTHGTNYNKPILINNKTENSRKEHQQYNINHNNKSFKYIYKSEEDNNDDDDDYDDYYEDTPFQYHAVTTTLSPNLAKVKSAYDSLLSPYRKHLSKSSNNDYSNQYSNSYPTIQTKSLKSHRNTHKSDEDEDDDDYYDEEKEQNDDNRNIKSSGNSENYDQSTRNSDGYNPGTLTKYKFDTLGTRENVEQSRNLYYQESISVEYARNQAILHSQRVISEGKCGIPKPTIIPMLGDANKEYFPHCTILHRCSDDTACCRTNSQSCVNKTSEPVELYFLVRIIGGAQSIEVHTLENHTECHCVSRTRNYRASSLSSHNMGNMNDSPYNSNRFRIQCPHLFEKVLESDTEWRCDCSSGNDECKNFKNGGEHFSIDDRRCINSKRCKPPKCDFGPYITEMGRCPLVHEKNHNYQNTYNRYS